MSTEPDAVVDELAELRRRAYGPHADIASDPVAQARLHDLEAAEREARSPVEVAVQNAPPAVAPEPPATERSALHSGGRQVGEADAEPTATVVDAEPDTDEPPAAPDAESAEGARSSRSGSRPLTGPLGWVRDHLAWLVAALAGIIAIAAVSTLVVGEFSRPHAELSFAIRSVPMNVATPDISAADRDLRGLPSGSLDFRGSLGRLDVWTTHGRDVNCILFSSAGQVYWSECAHSPLLPWSDFFTDDSLVPPYSLDPEIPNGSFVRFVWEGDDVKVYVVRKSGESLGAARTPAQAPPVASAPLDAAPVVPQS